MKQRKESKGQEWKLVISNRMRKVRHIEGNHWSPAWLTAPCMT